MLFPQHSIDEEEKQWAEEKKILERRQRMKAEKDTFKIKPSTSKLLILFLFINCTLIEVFTGYVTLRSFTLAALIGYNPDLTPLITLIGAVVGEVIGFAVYAVKAKAENTQGGVNYESIMYKLKNEGGASSPTFSDTEIKAGSTTETTTTSETTDEKSHFN